MFKKYLNIDEFKKSDFKEIHTLGNPKLYMYELFSKKEIENDKNKIEIRHDVMSYGDKNCIGKFATNFETIRFLALNEKYNKINRFHIKRDKNNNIVEAYQYYEPLCLVENKTKYYKLFFDFDYKYEKYPKEYEGFLDKHDEITEYILLKIIDTLNETINLTKKELEYVWAGKKISAGHHVYFPNIIVDKSLHYYIFENTMKKIKNDKKYPLTLIDKIFDECVSKANGLRLFYFKCNNDYYYPIKEKSTFNIDEDPIKHFYLCIINTNYSEYNNNLIISQDVIYKNIFVLNEKQKLKDDKKSLGKDEIEYVTDIKTLDLDDKKYLFKELINVLDFKRIDSYQSWISLVYLHKTYGLQEEITELSSKSKKFDDKAKQTIKDIFEDNKIVKNKITIGTLIKWAIEDCPSEAYKSLYKYRILLKFHVKSIDSILKKLNIEPNLSEKSEYISKNAIEEMCTQIKNKVKLITMMSPTGTGKTTAINKLIDYYCELKPNAKILSVITRRSMSACHISSFNTKDSKKKFVSYLDNEYESLDYFITSLENLVRVDEEYDLIILDEVNSLINYFYSSTLQNKRLRCITTLLNLLIKSELIISVDANITDIVFTFFNQLGKQMFYYVNSYQNKKDIPFNIFYSQTYSEDKNLISFCDKFIIEQYIKKNKKCLILTDSKETTDKLKLIFYKHNSNDDYYRFFNREQGTLEDMKNINKVGINRLLCASPRWIYGLDITIEYDEIFIIYRYTTGLESMGALEMIQQISRARKTKVVNLLALDPKACRLYNSYVDFEKNKKRQEEYINGYTKYQDELCKKYEAINEMGSTIISIDGKTKFAQDSFMTQIHYLKTWYDQLFYKNKIEIVKIIANEYGYKINEQEWTIPEDFVLKDKLNLNREEVVNVCKKIYKNEVIETKYKFYYENLKEQIRSRESYFNKINNIVNYNIDNTTVIKEESLVELFCDEDKFNNWLNRRYLEMDKKEFDTTVIKINNKDFLHTIKDNNIISKVKSCFWLEEQLKFKRFKINEIKCDDFEIIKKLFKDNIDNLFVFFKNNASKERIYIMVKNKIDDLNSLNILQKFISDCYNSISDDIFKIKLTKKYVKKQYISSTYIFEFNDLKL